MKNAIWAGGALAAALMVGGTAQANDAVSEQRPVNAQVARVQVSGLVELRVTQGNSAQFQLKGDKRMVDKIRTRQEGDTLHIDMESGNYRLNRGEGPVRAELVLPQLRSVGTESLGSTEIRGFSGERLDVALEGAGSMQVDCNYRQVHATLDGLGSLRLKGDAQEGIDVKLNGAGHVVLTGSSKWLRADLGGLGGLDAQRLQADAVNVDLSGLGSATVHARQSAVVNVSGMGSVTVYGKPSSRKYSEDGLGRVSWK
jgi:hypothetical protein